MNNNDVNSNDIIKEDVLPKEQDGDSLAVEKPGKKRKVSSVLVSIISALSVIAFIIYAALSANFVSLRLDPDAGLGGGIGAAILLIFMIIFGLAVLSFSIVALIWSIAARRGSVGGGRVVLLITTVLNAALPLLTVLAFIFILIINNNINSGVS